MTRVFLVRGPLRSIVAVDAEIRRGKWSWAVLKDGSRHLLGSTAFFTLAAAGRCRFALLMELTKNTYLQFYHPGRVDRARRELELYKQHGVTGWRVRSA